MEGGRRREEEGGREGGRGREEVGGREEGGRERETGRQKDIDPTLLVPVVI